MAEKVTYKMEADYAKLSEGYRRIKQEQVEAERAAKASEKEKQRIARETHREMDKAWNTTKDTQKRALRDGLQEMKRAAREHDESVGGMSQKWGALALRAGGAIAGMMSIGALVGVLRDIQQRFDGIAESADATARALRPLAVQVAGKEGPGFTRAAMLMGAKEGLSPEEVGELANTVKSIEGATQKDLLVGMRMTQLGVEGQDAAPIVQTGVVRGIGAQRAAELALTASDLAPWAPKDVAKALPKTMKFTSLEQGLAASATMRRAGIITEQIPYATEAVGRLLSKQDSPLAKKFKLKGLSETEQIARISAAADASGDREKFIRSLPEKYKVGEEEARGLQALLSQGDYFQRAEAALRAAPEGDVERRLAALREDPMQRREFEGRRAAAMARYQQEYGPMADAAAAERARTQATGMRLQEELPPEMAAAMTDANGRANWRGRTWVALQNRGGGSGVLGAMRLAVPGQTGGFGLEMGREFLPSVFGGRNGGEEFALNKKVDELVTALEANTAATRENSQASGGDSQAVASRVDRNAGL